MSHTNQPDFVISPRFLRLEAAQAYSGLSRSGIYRAIADGKILAKKVGRCLLLDRESIDRFINESPDAEIRLGDSPRRSAAN